MAWRLACQNGRQQRPKGRDGTAAGEVLGVLIAAGASLAMANPPPACGHRGPAVAGAVRSLEERRTDPTPARGLGGAMPDAKISGTRSKTGRCLRGAKRC